MDVLAACRHSPAPQQAKLVLTPQLRRSAQTTSKIETKKGAIRLPFSVQRQLSAVAFSALLQLGIGLYAGGDLVVGCYVQISILNGLNHFLLEIGRASCRERVESQMVVVTLQDQIKTARL